MSSPKHGRRAAPKPPARFRTRRTRDSARRPVVATSPAATGSVPRKTADRRSLRPAFSVLAMTFAGGMVLATSVPALAISATDSEPRASVYAPVEDTVSYEPQQLEVAGEAELKPLSTGGYAVEAAPPPIQSQVAGVGDVSVIDTESFAWPVINPAKISDGFGPRMAPCSGCSTQHDGTDYPSGNQTPVMAVADGVVTTSTDAGGGYGVYIEIQHNIGGELITSSYSHMTYGSRLVDVGATVTAGQQIGAIGATGQVTGPHLHLEVWGTDGVRFDGDAWLRERLG